MTNSNDLMRASPPTRAPLDDTKTERLVLRRFNMDDFDPLARIFAKEPVWRYPYGRALTEDETRAFLENQMAAWDALGYGLWLAIERESGVAIGYVGLSVPMFLPEILPAVEVGWRFDPDFWGAGYATEAAKAALEKGFTTLGLKRICSVPQSENPPSGRVCQRIGMTFERQTTIPENERRGALLADLYWIDAAEWQRRHSQS